MLIPYLVFFPWFDLVSNILPELCEVRRPISWPCFSSLVDLWWRPQTLADPCHSLAPASLDYQLLWPLCQLHPSCSNRPSGVLVCLGSNATHSVIFMIWQFCVKKEILPPSAIHYPSLSKNLWSSMTQEAKKYNLLTLLFSILHHREDAYKGSAI